MRTSFVFLTCLFVACCLTGCLPYGKPASETSVRIMCIGDSITQGGRIKDEYSYRLPLYRMLQKSGITVDFVGARSAGLDGGFAWPPGFDMDHESQYGGTTEYVDRMVEADLGSISAVPDIAIIDLGANDQGKDPGTYVVPYLVDIITHLRSKNPSIQILISQIPGIRINKLMHLEVFIMAKKYSRRESPILTVPLYWGWNTDTYTFDGSHPNLAGQEFMARKFFKAIMSLL